MFDMQTETKPFSKICTRHSSCIVFIETQEKKFKWRKYLSWKKSTATVKSVQKNEQP